MNRQYTETAADYYRQIDEALASAPDYRHVYSRLSRLLQRFMSQRTAEAGINFAGPFAMMDYLLKESRADGSLAHDANAMRTRFRHRDSCTAQELEQNWRQDLKALCLFIQLVDGTPVPDTLQALFPTATEHKAQDRPLEGRLRMIADRWDDTYIYGHADGYRTGQEVRVCYAQGNRNYPYDWSYLERLLYDGAQLNLVRPRTDNDGTLLPELIILEPDYLVDVTAVARCFTHYAESPLVNLINRLTPVATSQAILLGNFAGQILDEELHSTADETPDYRKSVTEFYRRNALSMLAADIDSRSFHNAAMCQRQNIHYALHELLPEAVSYFDPKEGIVEPSFYSETLGLQGRMDFMQSDYRVLMEQKSGKGSFPYNDFIRPTASEDHYVQLLLYMALIRYDRRSQYSANRELHAFLLYSKYSESLLELGMAPELIFRALKVRNGIAWNDMHMCREGAYGVLDKLTPERLNGKFVDDKLWRDYQRPQIAAVLDPIHQASPLEKAYFCRMLTFISNEHVLSKIGNRQKEGSGFASTWHTTLEEKRAAGNIYDNLTLVSPDSTTTGHITKAKLRFGDDIDNSMSNFRTGDIVMLYPYSRGTEPDIRKTMVIRCTVEDITTDGHIILNLRAPQTDRRAFDTGEDKLWAIEHDLMEASFTSLYRGMHTFLTAPQQRRDLLMLQRQPETDSNVVLRGDYGTFNDMQLHVKRAKDLFLIIGPPGTGKTSFGMLYTLQEELLEDGSAVLLMSYTNRAVDEICSKLEGSGIDYIRIGSELNCAKEYRHRLISAAVDTTDTLGDLRSKLSAMRVYVGTTAAVSSQLNLFDLRQFSLAIIDEASQILEPHLMPVLCAQHGGETAVRKIVMIGDHKQLPAVVQQDQKTSAVHDSLLHGICLTDCRLSLFERLLKRYHDNPDVVCTLNRQGRMHPGISAFAKSAFYCNALLTVPLPHQKVSLPHSGHGHDGIEDMLATRRIAFVSAELPEAPVSDKVNQTEADMIAATVLRIFRSETEAFDPAETVGIIVPYRNQIAAIRNTLDGYGITALHDISIDTVERYQGSQRKYIIYGFTVQQPYQLAFLTDNVFQDTDGTLIDRKLNVAMTRAEEHLVMMGHAPLLRREPVFRRLIDYAAGIGCFFEVPRDDYVSGHFAVPDYTQTEEE